MHWSDPSSSAEAAETHSSELVQGHLHHQTCLEHAYVRVLPVGVAETLEAGQCGACLACHIRTSSASSAFKHRKPCASDVHIPSPQREI